MRRKCIVFLVSCFVFFCCNNQIVFGFNSASDSPLKLAEVSIENIAKQLPQYGWNSTTKITSCFKTYDVYGDINGYIYNTITNDKESGYIQLFGNSETYTVLGYAFDGKHIATKLFEDYINQNSLSLDKAQLIYNGNFDYLVLVYQNNQMKYFNLMSQSSQNISTEEAFTDYTIIKNQLNINKLNYGVNSQTTTSTTSATPKYVMNANNADLVEMNDFSGKYLNGVKVDNHCAPTGAVNIVKYWAKRRGITKLWYQSDWWVFSSLCVNMDTDFKTGTYVGNIINGLRNYSTNTRGVSYSGSDWWGNNPLSEPRTFEKAKGYIDSNIPFLITIGLNFPNSHVISCFGYYSRPTGNQLIFNNGWNKSWTFQDVNSFNLMHYQYVRWN